MRKAGGPTPFVVQRNEDGQVREFTTVVDVERTERWVKKDDTSPTTIGAIGVAPAEFGPTHYNPLVGGARDVRVHRRSRPSRSASHW